LFIKSQFTLDVQNGLYLKKCMNGLSHILKGPGAVVNGLADVINVLVKCLSIFNWCWIR